MVYKYDISKYLDKKDVKILRELDNDPRQSINQIAKKVGLNKETTKYRLNKLERNLISHYWTIPKGSIVGNVYKILIKNKSLPDIERFIEYLQQEIVSWYAQTNGSYDFIISLTPKNLQEFSDFYTNLIEHFGKHINKREILITTRYMQTNETYLYSKNKLLYVIDESLGNQTELDKIDNQIIKILSHKGTSSFTDISKEIDLTPEATGKRFRKIKKKYITKIKPRLKYEKLGLEYYHLFLSLENSSIKEKIANYFIEKHEANCIMFHIGNFDVHLEFLTPIKKVENIITDLRKQFGQELKDFELLHIVKEYKLAII